MLLTLYRLATRGAGPLVRHLLERRVARGKEDPERLTERLGRATRARPPGQLIWIHGASVGESMAVLPLIEALLARRPELEILVTTGTVTSARLLADRLPRRARHQFLPVDQPAACQRFYSHWRPDLGIIAESELWPNLLAGASAQGVPMVLLNGRMSERSFRRWQRLPRTARALLERFELVLAQSEADRDRLERLGTGSVRYLGNLKRASAPLPADTVMLADLRQQVAGRTLWLAASTHPGEEAVVLDLHQRLRSRFPNLLTMVVPRHPERGMPLAEAARDRGLALARRSAGERPGPEIEVYAADTIGELGLFYRLAPIAFVGGSLIPHGGQNPLEAARLGCPPLYGPNTWNFAELTLSLEAQGGAERVEDAPALGTALERWLDDPEALRRFGERAERAAESEQAVLSRTLEALSPLLERTLGPANAAA